MLDVAREQVALAGLAVVRDAVKRQCQRRGAAGVARAVEAVASRDRVGPGAAVHAVVRATAVERVVARAAAQDVDARATAQHVGTVAADQAGRPPARVQPVGARAAVERDRG